MRLRGHGVAQKHERAKKNRAVRRFWTQAWTLGLVGLLALVSMVFAEAEPPPAPPAPLLAPVKRKVMLRGVNFAADSAEIGADARPILDEAVSVLLDEDISVVAVGHTDNHGSEQYNQELSVRRATAVGLYLVDGGVESSRIEVKGCGGSLPVASNDTEEGRAQNRRVELQVIQE